MNNNFRYRYSLDDDKTDALSKHELSQVNALLAGDNPTSSDTKYQPGVYHIGKDMPAGSYWVEGNDTQVTYYFVLKTEQNTSSKEAYNVSNGNHYYGHNIIEVSEGDVLVIEEEAVPLNQMNEKFSAPYKSGMYRVGIDIPAGTYTLSAGKADDLYGYFIMKDLSYSETSYLEQSYFMNMNEHPTITLNEVTYIELYNLTMKPSTVTT